MYGGDILYKASEGNMEQTIVRREYTENGHRLVQRERELPQMGPLRAKLSQFCCCQWRAH